MTTHIPFIKPEHPDQPRAYLNTLRHVLPKHLVIDSADSIADQFERKMAELCGCVYASAFSSSVLAFKVVLSFSGIGKGHHVMCPSYMPLRYVNAIIDCGATPIFIDLKPRQFEIDAEQLAARVSEKSKAILLAYPYGIPCNPKNFQAIAKKHSLTLIELILGTPGSKFQSKLIGTFGNACVIEYHPKRSTYASDGGFLLTDQEDLATYARHWLLSKPSEVEASMPRRRMSEFYGAIGLWMLDRLQEVRFRSLQLSRRYDDALRNIDNIVSPSTYLKNDWSHTAYPVLIEGDRRNRIADALSRYGIETQRGYLPCHTNPVIEALIRPPRLPHTEMIHEQTLLLPMYPSLTREDQDKIISILLEALKKYPSKHPLEARA